MPRTTDMILNNDSAVIVIKHSFGSVIIICFTFAMNPRYSYTWLYIASKLTWIYGVLIITGVCVTPSPTSQGFAIFTTFLTIHAL